MCLCKLQWLECLMFIYISLVCTSVFLRTQISDYPADSQEPRKSTYIDIWVVGRPLLSTTWCIFRAVLSVNSDQLILPLLSFQLDFSIFYFLQADSSHHVKVHLVSVMFSCISCQNVELLTNYCLQLFPVCRSLRVCTRQNSSFPRGLWHERMLPQSIWPAACFLVKILNGGGSYF